MKLTVFDKGDMSVGIFPTNFEIDCPFERCDMEQEHLNEFKEAILKLYTSYDYGNYALYDYELKELFKQENDFLNSQEDEARVD